MTDLSSCSSVYIHYTWATPRKNVNVLTMVEFPEKGADFEYFDIGK